MSSGNSGNKLLSASNIKEAFGPKRSAKLVTKKSTVGKPMPHQARDIPSDTPESVLRVNISTHTDFNITSFVYNFIVYVVLVRNCM